MLIFFYLSFIYARIPYNLQSRFFFLFGWFFYQDVSLMTQCVTYLNVLVEVRWAVFVSGDLCVFRLAQSTLYYINAGVFWLGYKSCAQTCPGIVSESCFFLWLVHHHCASCLKVRWAELILPDRQLISVSAVEVLLGFDLPQHSTLAFSTLDYL